MNISITKLKERRHQPWKKNNLEEKAAYLFLLPWLIGLMVFILGPALATGVISLTNWNMITQPAWVGPANYIKMMGDANFWQSIRVTLYYMVLAVPTLSIVGLLVSLLLNQRLPGMNFIRTVLYLPAVLSGVAVAVLWLSLLNPDAGVINSALRALGIANPPNWLNDAQWAVPAVVLISLWGVGGNAIIYLAGLQNIPPGLYDAASIDGANDIHKFFSITLPLLSPTMFFVLITNLVGAFQVFDIAFILGGSRGGRGGSLLFYLLYIWNEGFRSSRMGYASALSMVLIIISSLVIVVVVNTSDRWVYSEVEEK
ncbi:MAG: sugar ABC transporter permease [Anaerolineales bacterium]|jgi:multiple sugar transport system permease protein